MTRFIELTYYEYSTLYPDKSKNTGKKFLLNVSDISSIIPYAKSTKIRYKGGESIEVCESYEEVTGKMKGA